MAAPPRPAPRCAHVPGRPPSRAAARGEGWGGNQTARPPRRSRPPPGPHGDRPPRTHPRGWSGAGHDTSAHSSDPLGARAGGAALARRLRSAGSLSRARGRPGSGQVRLRGGGGPGPGGGRGRGRTRLRTRPGSRLRGAGGLAEEGRGGGGRAGALPRAGGADARRPGTVWEPRRPGVFLGVGRRPVAGPGDRKSVV